VRATVFPDRQVSQAGGCGTLFDFSALTGLFVETVPPLRTAPPSRALALDAWHSHHECRPRVAPAFSTNPLKALPLLWLRAWLSFGPTAPLSPGMTGRPPATRHFPAQYLPPSSSEIVSACPFLLHLAEPWACRATACRTGISSTALSHILPSNSNANKRGLAAPTTPDGTDADRVWGGLSTSCRTTVGGHFEGFMPCTGLRFGPKEMRIPPLRSAVQMGSDVSSGSSVTPGRSSVRRGYSTPFGVPNVFR